MMLSAKDYDAWYKTARGSWIGQQEYSTLLKLFSPKHGQTLLDIGSGSAILVVDFMKRDYT